MISGSSASLERRRGEQPDRDGERRFLRRRLAEAQRVRLIKTPHGSAPTLANRPPPHLSLGTQKHIHTGNKRLQGGRNRTESTPQFISLPAARRKAAFSLDPVITAAKERMGLAFSVPVLEDRSPAGDGNTARRNGGFFSSISLSLSFTLSVFFFFLIL